MKESQYTVRGIPPIIDSKLRHKARASRRSLNQVTIDTLAAGLNIKNLDASTRSDLAGLAAFDQAKKSPSRLDKTKSVKQLYRESIAKKHGL